MKNWWEENQPEEPQATAQPRSGRSVYEEYYATRASSDSKWTPVGEVDALTGEYRAVDGWERRVGGWQPLGEFLAERSGDPLRNILRGRGPL